MTTIKKILIYGAGFLFLALGAIGIFLPILPTTPFVLLAAACFSTSPTMHGFIMKIPFVNEYISNYEDKKGVSKKTVVVSLVFLWCFMLFSLSRIQLLWVFTLVFCIAITVTVHILHVSRPRTFRAEGLKSVKTKKRLFGYFEATFDVVYLYTALYIGFGMWMGRLGGPNRLVGACALVLAAGDAFHLIPRILVAITGREQELSRALGFGKFVTSITMTVFYLLLCHIGVLYLPVAGSAWLTVAYMLGAIRIVLCLAPQNAWVEPHPPIKWAVYRNIPFLLLGVVTVLLFASIPNSAPALQFMPLAIVLSFAFYIPVVLWAHKYRMLGMLMLPKTCMYIWILWMLMAL